MKELVQIKINGFKSIQKLDIQLGSINVLIGANGAGKSNFISFFRMLNELMEGRLQFFVAKSGGASAMLHYGTKVTTSIDAKLYFDLNAYEIQLIATEDDQFVFGKERLCIKTTSISQNPDDIDKSNPRETLGSGHKESLAGERYQENELRDAQYAIPDLRSWRVYHFHDTSLNFQHHL